MISLWRTSRPPVRVIVDRLHALEREAGVLSVSFGHGFPWADVADVGARTLAITDGDPARAAAIAQTLARDIFAARHDTADDYDTIDGATDAALAGPGPVILADVADNAGGGAPSDSTFVVRRLLERGVRDVASGYHWDPVAVQFCAEAGIGATFDLRVGGKSGPASGAPLDLRATVRGFAEDHDQGGLGGGRAAMGPSAWIEADGIHLILTTRRGQPFHPDGFTGLGCTLADKRIIVVKSMQHFHAGFAPLARDVRYVAAPGALSPDPTTLGYTKIRTPWWPMTADPWG